MSEPRSFKRHLSYISPTSSSTDSEAASNFALSVSNDGLQTNPTGTATLSAQYLSDLDKSPRASVGFEEALSSINSFLEIEPRPKLSAMPESAAEDGLLGGAIQVGQQDAAAPPPLVRCRGLSITTQQTTANKATYADMRGAVLPPTAVPLPTYPMTRNTSNRSVTRVSSPYMLQVDIPTGSLFDKEIAMFFDVL